MGQKLPEHIEQVMDEMYEQRLKKPIKSIELPCTQFHKYREPALVQIHEARNQIVVCPRCGRKQYLIWSKLQDNMKWQK